MIFIYVGYALAVMLDVAGLVMSGIAIYKAFFKEYFDIDCLDYVLYSIILAYSGLILGFIISFLRDHANL
jgi:hypothetical protein